MKGERGKKQRMNTHTQSLTYTEGVVGLKSTTAGDCLEASFYQQLQTARMEI